MTNAEAWFNKPLCPQKPEGSLGRTAQDVHLDSHTAPELWHGQSQIFVLNVSLGFFVVFFLGGGGGGGAEFVASLCFFSFMSNNVQGLKLPFALAQGVFKILTIICIHFYCFYCFNTHRRHSCTSRMS